MELRRLHGLMDGAVLRAYGWDDLADSAVCGFGLDYLEVEDDSFAQPDSLWWSSAAEAHAFEGSLPASRKRLPWRYRWPDDFRDEVLARLLELNEQSNIKPIASAIWKFIRGRSYSRFATFLICLGISLVCNFNLVEVFVNLFVDWFRKTWELPPQEPYDVNYWIEFILGMVLIGIGLLIFFHFESRYHDSEGAKVQS